MNDSRDPFEESLRRFRPRSVSAATRRRVAERMTVARSRLLVGSSLGLLVAAVAASLLVTFFFRNDSPGPPVEPTNHDILVERDDAAQVEIASSQSVTLPPTLWVYRRAADVSMDDFGVLLEQHARELMVPESRTVVAGRPGDRERRLLD